jgi:hypothetical protein
MAFVRQDTSDTTFVAWGKPKGENSYVIKEKEPFVAVVSDIQENDTYKRIYKLRCKDIPDELMALGNTSLNRGMGYGLIKDGNNEIKNWELPDSDPRKTYVVQAGDTVELTFKGMVSTKAGRKAYAIDVAVDSESESYKKYLKARKK